MSKEEKKCKKHECKNVDKQEKCHCSSDCKCGCQEGKECTCDTNCKCGCQEGKECTCDTNCKCGCQEGKECTCENCKCSDLKPKLELLEQQLEESKKLASQYLNTASYYKTQAEDNKKDFERFKERNKNIENEANTKANENVAKKILPIIDNFDQAMAHVVDVEILKGFSMIYSSLVSVLSDIGVVEIVCKDEILNPEFHNCISTEDTDDESLNEHIACIYQKGYMFAESKKVVRPATVSIYKINS